MPSDSVLEDWADLHCEDPAQIRRIERIEADQEGFRFDEEETDE